MAFMHSNDINIKTERLLLRQFQMDDVEDMLANWIADPRVQGEYGEPTYEASLNVIKLLDMWIQNYDEVPSYRWAIVLNETNVCIGQIGFCCIYLDDRIAEVEYCIGREFWNKGYASEALNAVIKHTFDNTDFVKLEAFYRNKNVKSGGVLRKANMKIVSNVRRFELKNELPKGKICYAIYKEDL